MHHITGLLFWSLIFFFQMTDSRLTGFSYERDPYVIDLKAKNFDNLVLHSNDVWAIEFYALWCPACKRLAPEWSKTAENLKSEIRVGAVNIPYYPDLRARYQIWGFPTILIFAGDKTKPYTYKGPQSADAMSYYFRQIALAQT
ncbi:protein disulfide-isomerase 2-3-like [Stegodyphus dumicola]|uniref:protein disulfide-isomerase 2-3-like n=1 Tax=Stegodyphus dumicola TaxID=202533 RepID=UPI0015B17929|nr:protein disulfide-isomerase 2-3-like [Stegodyphus dumicola]